MAEGPVDPGLQPERTLLAWRRTCLTLAVGNVVGVRLTVADLGSVTVLVGLVGLLLTGVAWMVAAQRYRRVRQDLARGRVALAPGGLAVVTTCGAAATLSVLALALLLVP